MLLWLGLHYGRYNWVRLIVNAYIYTMAQKISKCSLTLSQNLNFLSYSSNRHVYPDSFSTCSQSSLKTFLQKFDSSCLLDVPDVGELYGGPVCGNAFVEKGEECDCGTVEVWHVAFKIFQMSQLQFLDRKSVV